MASMCDSCLEFRFQACVSVCASCEEFDKGCRACPKEKGCGQEPARVDDLGADE